MRNLEEERLGAIRGDEVDGTVGQMLGRALGRGATGGGRLRVALGFMRDFPALLRRAEARAAEMPFAEVARLVAGSAEAFGKGLDLERELQRHGRIGEPGIGPTMTGNVLRNAEARLVLAALEIRARGRANGAGVEIA